MSNRFKEALQIQEGASNRRLVSRKLHEMIVEVSDAGGDADSDPAVFLVLHQLVWILAGHDFTIGRDNERLGIRWKMAEQACEAKVAELAEREALDKITLSNSTSPVTLIPVSDFDKANEVKS